jgi:hypothetical protein
MRKMVINGVPYLVKVLLWNHPDNTGSSSILVCYPQGEPDAAPLFLIDNNGTNPFAEFSFANWLPAPGVHFEDPAGRPVTWE